MDPRTILPHRYQFLLLDTIDEVHSGKSARGTKVVTGSEWLVIGTTGTHTLRAMPHLLIVEALAQRRRTRVFEAGCGHREWAVQALSCRITRDTFS